MQSETTERTEHYRLFVTNGRGHIDRVAHEIHVASDDEAFAKAVEMVDDVPFEVGDGGRRVATAGHGERETNRLGD